MKVTGILMECNPFHEGHAYLLEKARSETGADYLVAAMSGDYVQRGEPAVYDKYLRAEKILHAGADLVLELPLYAACGSADYFARGGLALLDRLGVVDSLCFGSESGDAPFLQECAERLLNAEQDACFRERLQEHLREGLSFPAARSRAIQEAGTLPGASGRAGGPGRTTDVPAGSSRSTARPGSIPDSTGDPHRPGTLPDTPNDLLAVEYCRAILLSGSGIRPHAVRRIDVPSATQRRERLLRERGSSLTAPMPAFPLGPDDFSAQLLYALRMQETRLDRFADVSADLADRIRGSLPQFRSFSGFCGLVKTKNVTYTRVSRALLHILLQMEKERLAQLQSAGLALYARPLAMRRAAAPLLNAIRKNASIPFLPKLSAASSVLSPEAMSFLEEEIRAEELYALTLGFSTSPAGCGGSPASAAVLRAPQRRMAVT